jgi:hypothetical protein
MVAAVAMPSSGNCGLRLFGVTGRLCVLVTLEGRGSGEALQITNRGSR